MARTAVLLANLGSPDSTEVSDVKKYLSEFLMDERVIDIPYLIRSFLVKGIIVPFRSPKSAEKYKLIWTKDGSPLIHISRQVQASLQQQMQMPVELCMRYGNPTAEAAFERLISGNPDLEEVILVPLYPHYAMSSYETAVMQIKNIHQSRGYRFSLAVVPPFYNQPKYIQSLAATVQPYLAESPDHILFSYHGIPERHIRKTDKVTRACLKSDQCCEVNSAAHPTCYRHQVFKTTDLTAAALGLSKGSYSTSFQSRLGSDDWLQPYTSAVLSQLPKQGVRKLLVLSPAFVSDCLETLEEIQMEGRKTFLDNGGKEFIVVPCLNDRSDWIHTLESLVKENMSSTAAAREA